ncbi:Putative Superfamily I helicase [endosymbiont DhMRE of Dentiscutata heterogama]|uniref:AAA domain-containing protein n=1 Tax=endosymbiont DhMRE of Dentiscutata heterogama TaxID=1609546 RepID=UPI000629D7C7|nr:AAA domain-containing protein [endosymbiont DhMRE of Dentiscutata heterogama]CFW93364.1 Putative Superfamily I helicase [endosymbiont DhMRE of Dentiscutata heterogama]
MTNNSELSAEIVNLTKLRDKLLDLRANSPKIKLYLRKDLTWDLSEIDELALTNNINFSLGLASELNLLLKGEKEIIFLDLSPLLRSLEKAEEKEKIRKKVKQLWGNSQRIYLEKGVNSLWLGLFFCRGYLFENYVINAPLFFFPAKISKNGLGITVEKDKKINYTLLYFFKKIFKLEEDSFRKCREKLENNSQDSLKHFLLDTQQTLRELLQNHTSIKLSDLASTDVTTSALTLLGTSFASDELKLESFLYLTRSNKTEKFKEDELEISFNAVLTIDREVNLSLFNDFEQMIEKCTNDNLQNYPSSGLDLLTNKEEKDDYTNTGSFSTSSKHVNERKKIYIPFDSDPSQSHILKKVLYEFHKNVLCIDGPPGTGKTQLICNLISNCLIYNQKVAVVCEKDVALQVIHDKLNKIGIKQSAIKINELGQTINVYRHIVEVEEMSRKSRMSYHANHEYEAKMTDLEERNTLCLEKLRDYHKIQKDFHAKRGILLGKVYVETKSTKRTSELISLIKWVENEEQSDKLKSNLEDYVGKLKQVIQKQKEICLDLKHLFLSYNQLNFAFIPLNESYLNDIIYSLLQELRGMGNSKLLSQIFRIKLVWESRKKIAAVHLLERKRNEFIFLSQRPDLKILFFFLDIKSLDEFWQKCSQETFLLSLQKFVNTNFSAVGSLSYLVNSLDKNTQEIVRFLLEKVFNFQEFDWLEDYPKIVEQTVYLNWISLLEEKGNVQHWGFLELNRIHREMKTINEEKKRITQEILKVKQQINHQSLSVNGTLIQLVKRKRNIPRLRKLLPELLNCFPVWLMTPEVMSSVAEFGRPSFDLLVFDESSQITLESSIPLLVRAKKCLIIGDEKQLPPTNFFKLLLDEDEELAFEEEEEEEKIIGQTVKTINLQPDDLRNNFSLLNWAKKYVNPNQKETLLYHYRSKYPELIDFSNQAFYHGVLQVVRDNEDRKNYSPIEFIKIKGKWINNQNDVEARYIVDELLEKRLLGTEKSLGIVTFNKKQRQLLESRDEIIEKWKTKNNLFIKNLEEVQGDERDIIIFSIGYAPNEEGRFLHFFGPLSKEGGENRLNVAISRAKEKVIVVSSILPSELNVANSKNIGPKLLKEYLEYAWSCQGKDWVKQQQILAEKIPMIINTSYSKDKKADKFDSPFEEEVYQELVKLGFEVETQVGSFGYRIDLAVRNSQNNSYVLGIECDGWAYHHRSEDVERDEYRQNILENKGWNIIRICSRDWWGDNNKKRTIDWIKKEIEKNC